MQNPLYIKLNKNQQNVYIYKYYNYSFIFIVSQFLQKE